MDKRKEELRMKRERRIIRSAHDYTCDLSIEEKERAKMSHIVSVHISAPNKEKIESNEVSHQFDALLPLIKKYGRVIVFDIETSGLSDVTDSIIEFGAVTLTSTSEKVVATGDSFYIKQSKPLSSQIIELTGITDSTLSNIGIDKALAEQKIIDTLFAQSGLICAYNAQFDLRFVYSMLKRVDKTILFTKCKYLDVMTIYKDRASYPHKLSDAMGHYHIAQTSQHDALGNAKSELTVLCAMFVEKGDVENYVNIFGHHQKYGVNGEQLPAIRYIAQNYNSILPLYKK